MAVNLTYDPSDDPEAIEAEEQRDVESLEVADKLQEEEQGLLAGKYKDAEELEKAYIELQKKLGSDGKEETEASTEETEEEVKEETEDPFEDDVAAQTIFQASDEFADNGEISADTMEALTKMDSKDLVEAYQRIQSTEVPTETTESTTEEPGQQLSAESVNEIRNAVGGEEAYTKMVSWAQENLAPNEIQAYDNAIASGNLDTINLALQAVYYRYTDDVGSEGDMIQGKAATAVDGFRSQAEVVRAMADPRYENDPAYRQDVYNKLERSNIKF
tara:strand:- start:71 stop:892 length:822 start_codon:yes stop_codon:yes gene_type:complete